MPDQNKRALLIEAMITAGLIVIGIPTGQVPLVALATAVAGTGSNWAHSLAQRGFQHWCEGWFTDNGVLNHDIEQVLYQAYIQAVKQLEQGWKPYYEWLQRKDKEEAEATVYALYRLREEGANLLLQPKQLTQVTQKEQLTQRTQHEHTLSFLYQDNPKSGEYLKQALREYLNGYNEVFITFVAERLGPEWILRFVEILKDPDNKEGTRAWRACQLLWQKSLMLGIEQIQQTMAETADTVRWLEGWAQQLKNQPLTERNSTGQDALESILHSVHAQLDEMQQTLDKTYITTLDTYNATLDIQARLEQVYPKGVPVGMAPPQVWNVPFLRNPYFTGRIQLLERLHEQLGRSHRAALNQSQALTGLGGIGKTQAAIEYAYRYRLEYTAVFWVLAANRETLVADYVAVARLLGLPDQDAPDQLLIVAAVKRWLEQHEGWLLILDNADDLSLLTDILPGGGQGHLLLTTRVQATGKIAQSLSVEKMELSEGIQLLLRRAKLLAPEEPLDNITAALRKGAQQLVTELDGLPLALDQAGAYIEETGCSLSEYLELYARHRTDLLKRQSSVSADYPHTVTSTWALSFQNVEQASPAAADLLRLCAFLGPDAIPEAILTEGATELGPVLSPVAADPLLLNEALQVLRRYSLLKRDSEVKLLNIHRLVQVVLKDSLDKATQKLWGERAVRAVNTAFPEVSFETWSRCELCLPHVQACAGLIDEHNFTFPEAARLLNRAGWYLFRRGLYGQAEPLLQRALTMQERVLGPEHPDTLRAVHNLANLYWSQCQYEQAKRFGQRALTMRERVLGPEHPDTLRAVHDLATLYRDQSQYEQAERLSQRALTMQERVLGPEHPDTLRSVHDLATLYRDQGQYEQAERLFKRALTAQERVLGPEHPDTLSTIQELATLYTDRGKYEQAEPLSQRALTIREKRLGPEHPDTAMSLNNLALLYYDQGQYVQAEPLFKRALAIMEQQLGPEHPRTATVRKNYRALVEDMKRKGKGQH